MTPPPQITKKMINNKSLKTCKKIKINVIYIYIYMPRAYFQFISWGGWALAVNSDKNPKFIV